MPRDQFIPTDLLAGAKTGTTTQPEIYSPTEPKHEFHRTKNQFSILQRMI
ncbi:hypothetical protein J2W17_001078 [Pseudomonas lini]|nr:hypothetical protein [Pseudomonas lini]